MRVRMFLGRLSSPESKSTDCLFKNLKLLAFTFPSSVFRLLVAMRIITVDAKYQKQKQCDIVPQNHIGKRSRMHK